MASRRCLYCEVRWPDTGDYDICPQCRELTSYTMLGPTISDLDAVAIARDARFGWWLYDHGWL